MVAAHCVARDMLSILPNSTCPATTYTTYRYNVTLTCVDNRDKAVQSVLVSSKNATQTSSARTPRSHPRNSRVTPVGALLVTIIGAIAAVVAVFGHPTQAIAAAVITSALAALAGGRQVLRSSAELLGPITRFLSSTRGSAHMIDASDRPPLAQSLDSKEDGGAEELTRSAKR